MEIDRGEESNEREEGDADERAPDPPGPRQSADDPEERRHDEAAKQEIQTEKLELIDHPGAEGLRGEAVLMLAEVALVDGQREAENRSEEDELDPVKDRLQRFERRDALSEIAHLRGPAEAQHE